MPLPPKAELQLSPAAKDNTVAKGMLPCAPSYWRKFHFYLSKTTFPFYRWQKKDRPHLSALHNPAAASKAMFTWEKDTGQMLCAGFPDSNGRQRLETKETAVDIIQIRGSPVWKSLGKLCT